MSTERDHKIEIAPNSFVAARSVVSARAVSVKDGYNIFMVCEWGEPVQVIGEYHPELSKKAIEILRLYGYDFKFEDIKR